MCRAAATAWPQAASPRAAPAGQAPPAQQHTHTRRSARTAYRPPSQQRCRHAARCGTGEAYDALIPSLRNSTHRTRCTAPRKRCGEADPRPADALRLCSRWPAAGALKRRRAPLRRAPWPPRVARPAANPAGGPHSRHQRTRATGSIPLPAVLVKLPHLCCNTHAPRELSAARTPRRSAGAAAACRVGARANRAAPARTSPRPTSRPPGPLRLQVPMPRRRSVLPRRHRRAAARSASRRRRAAPQRKTAPPGRAAAARQNAPRAGAGGPISGRRRARSACRWSGCWAAARQTSTACAGARGPLCRGCHPAAAGCRCPSCPPCCRRGARARRGR